MKRSGILILALVLATAGFAQKKPKISKANSARERGDLTEAKAIIDEAITHPKTKDEGKTWYYRGLIYAALDTTSNPQYADLSKGAMEEAVKSFGKADEIDPNGKQYFIGVRPMFQQVSDYHLYYYNKGVNAFGSEDYPSAVTNFEKAYFINPRDSNAYVNAAVAAHSAEMYDAAARNYQKAIDNGSASLDIYYNYVNVLLNNLEDKERGLKVIDEGLSKFPADPGLSKTKINLLIGMDRIDEAQSDLEAAIESEPDNPSLYFTLGVLKEEVGKPEEARKAYQSAIEVDPDHFESNYNYGVMLINDANDVIKESNSLGISKSDLKRAKELNPIIDQKLEAALPQWERINEIEPNDAQVIETLSYIYSQLKMYDKAEAMQNKLKALETK